MSEIERIKLSNEMRVNLKRYILIKRRQQLEENNIKEQKVKIKVKRLMKKTIVVSIDILCRLKWKIFNLLPNTV